MSQDFHQSIFNHLKKNANISPDEIMGVAQSVQNANFSDEATVRNLVKQLSSMANRPLSKERENQIVELITKKNNQIDSNMLQQIFKK